MPDSPTIVPRVTRCPALTTRLDRYETETLNPGTGSIVTEIIPATDPAKVTIPDAGARTGVPTEAEWSAPQCPP